MSFVRFVKLNVPAGAAKPGPAIGQSLGPLGINMAEFCKQFNEATDAVWKKEVPLRVRLHAMSDRSFTFDVRSPSTPYLIKQAIGITKGTGSPDPNKPFAYIAPEAVYAIAQIKRKDDNLKMIPLDSVCRMVVGTARTMGIICKEFEDMPENQKKKDEEVDVVDSAAAAADEEEDSEDADDSTYK